MTDKTGFLISILPGLPLFLAYLVGLGLGIAWARAARGGGLAAGVGFALLAASWMVGAATQYWLMTMPRDAVAGSIGTLAGLSLFREGAALAGTVLLMIAIFARPKAAANA
ncbi:MAG TPA: hypothetical protein VF211_10410 [Burkholderiales bacterium]